MNEPELIREMLQQKQGKPLSIAVVGLSENAGKPSHYVSAYLQQQGYRIFPVNPAIQSVLGEKSYASLKELPERPDIVDVFRLPSFLPGIIDEMLELGFRNLWVQQGIINLDAAKKAEQGGIRVVMDRCIMVEHRTLNGG